MRVVLVCGMAQQGKTTQALALVQRTAKRVVILDPARSKPFNGVRPVWTSFRALAQFLVSPAARGRWVGVLRTREFGEYILALRAAPYYRHVTVLLDEALKFTSDLEALGPLIDMARTNAHFGNGLGVPLVMTAQRPLDLPPDVRSQVDAILSGRQREPRDLAWLSGFASPDFAAEVAELPPHTFIAFPPGALKPGRSRHHVQAQDDRRDRPGGARGARVLPDVPEAEPDPQAPGPAEELRAVR